jgi:polyhydroxybutyrate depolymerase
MMLGPRLAILCSSALLLLSLFLPGTLNAQATGEHRPSRREQHKGASAADQKRQVTSGGLDRSYLLYVPGSVSKDKAVPLVLVFHGGGGHDYNMPRFTHFDELADKEGFIVAYPESLNTHWNDGRDLSPADDIGFVKALIAEVERLYPVDPKRVYATGMSNGGFFSQRIACDLSDRVAAVASVAATLPEPLAGTCHPVRPLSVMFIQGTDDPLVHINGGPIAKTHGRNISLDDSAKFWVEKNGASSKPQSSDLPSHDTNGTSVHKDVYSGGKGGTEVVVYTIRGGGHTWPSAPQYMPAILVGKTNHDLDATQAIWEFFATHSRQ